MIATRAELLALCLCASGCGDSGGSGAESTTETSTTTTTATTSTTATTAAVSTTESTSGSDTSGDSSTTASLPPEIDVEIESTPVPDGGAFEFATTADVGATVEAVVTISNGGSGDLHVVNVALTAGDVDHFAIDDTMLEMVIEPGSNSTFSVAFAPVNGGFKSVEVSIDNDDVNESPYEFTVDAGTTPNTYRELSPSDAPADRVGSTMAYLEDGRVLLFGGFGAPEDYNDTWIFDVEAGDWSELSPTTPPPRWRDSDMVYVGDGKVVMFGGSSGWNDTMFPTDAETWVFDADTNEWTDVTPAVNPLTRYLYRAARIGDGRLLLHGGEASVGLDSDQTWEFDIADGTWTQLAPSNVPTPSLGMHMDYDGDDLVVMNGGLDTFHGVAMTETWHFHISTGEWTLAPAAALAPARFYGVGSFFDNGELIIFSGGTGPAPEPTALPGTFSYDPETNAWADLAPLAEPPPRRGAASAYVGRNKAIIFGGRPDNPPGGENLGDTWEYVGP